MVKKIIETLKVMVGICLLIIIPSFVLFFCVKSATNKDVKKCLDTFMQAEGVGVSKYMALQFENSFRELDDILSGISSAGVTDPKVSIKEIKSIIEHNNNIVSLSMYDEKGKFLVNSLNTFGADLMSVKDFDTSKKEIKYDILQLEDKNVAIKYKITKKITDKKGKEKKYFLELTMKWNQYEKYMMRMEQGSIPRMFYIISPDCGRYISLNSLPQNSINKVAVAALGMHLAKKINDIAFGLTDVKIESVDFRILKEEIKMPPGLIGSKFFVVVATDNIAFEELNKSMFDSLDFFGLLFIMGLLGLCLYFLKFYQKAKEDLEIATVIRESTPLALVIFKVSDGSVLEINLSATTLLRIEREEISKINMWSMFIENEDRGYVSSATSSGISVLNYEVLIQSFGGGTFWSICSASPIEVSEEKYIVLAVLDIDRRKEIEKKLSNNAALLEKQIAERTADLELKAKELEVSNSSLESAKLAADEASNAKSKFLTNMSNELKTPLNAIIGYSEILEEEALDRKDTVSADDLKKIIGSAKHLLSLIDEILDLSKIESGKTQLFFENIELVSLIKDVEGITLPLVAKNDNSMFLEYPKDIGVMYSDSTKLRQCLLNLLSNAAKFTEFGKITLRIVPLVKTGEDFVEFSVIDTGAGIDQAKLANLFETFQEGNAGAGLGLSLTKKYVECLGGTVTVESEIGAGSKFVIRVPRTCKTVSGDSIEVKNQDDDDEADDGIIFEEVVSGKTKDTTEGGVFSRKSDQNL
ncbi:MAG: PAS domain-containing sensor histidine kinase [Holosporaceae bacterium]|jgi:PAS domain S-box-containing protein|nr:PAS domain-containing sensor histidine kinase [Holosporaceae bacterium]